MISMNFNQCLDLPYSKLSIEEQKVGLNDMEVNLFLDKFKNNLLNSNHRGKFIYFEGANKGYTYGSRDWQNYYDYFLGAYRKKLGITDERFQRNHDTNLALLLKDFIAEGFSEIETQELINKSIDEFLELYREIHKSHEKQKKIS